MKTITVILAVLCLFSSVAQAAGAAVCPAIEFAELQTMSDKELKEKYMDYFGKLTRFAPGSENYNPYSSSEKDNCKDQMKRIDRIEKARAEAKK